MRDKFANVRLPDLPIAGYATTKEKELTDAVMFFLRGAERDRLFLLSLVCDGPEKFRRVAMKAWRYLRVDGELVNAVYGYLVLLAGENPEIQRDQLLRLKDMTPVRRIRHITGLERSH